MQVAGSSPIPTINGNKCNKCILVQNTVRCLYNHQGVVLLGEVSISKGTQTSKYVDNFPTQKAKVDDIEIEYKTLGNKGGKPIIFIPGLKVTMDMWEPTVLEELVSSNHSVIV